MMLNNDTLTITFSISNFFLGMGILVAIYFLIKYWEHFYYWFLWIGLMAIDAACVTPKLYALQRKYDFDKTPELADRIKEMKKEYRPIFVNAFIYPHIKRLEKENKLVKRIKN